MVSDPYPTRDLFLHGPQAKDGFQTFKGLYRKQNNERHMTETICNFQSLKCLLSVHLHKYFANLKFRI